MIELLVVVTIISVLAAILFPVFATARERARQSVCSSNMRQIGLGVISYSQDFDERCPMYYTGYTVTPGNRSPGYHSPDAGPDQYWTELVSPYIQKQSGHDFGGASKVFFCPSARFDPDVVSAHLISNIPSYGLTDNWTEWYCPSDCNNGTGQAHSFTEATTPASTILLAETLVDGDTSAPGFGLALTPVDSGNTGYTYGACDSAGVATFSPERKFIVLSWRHSGGKRAWCESPRTGAKVMVAYADGHVTGRTLSDLADYKQWAIKQGNGDVGCFKNADGANGCWYP